MAGSFHVLNPRFIARGITVIPVAVEQRAVRHTHGAAVGLVKQQRLRAVHPEGVLHFEVFQIAFRTAHAVLLKQFHHQRKDRRLGAAEIIGTVAVGNMPVAFNQPGEVIRHTFQQIVTTALRQPQHGEIGIPVVGLAESSAGNDIGLGQRQQGRPGNMILRLARQHRPQAVNVLFEGQTGVGDIFRTVGLRQPEVVFHKLAQVEIPVASDLAVADQDIQRIHLRRAVGKGFAVREQARGLHVLKQFKIAVCGRQCIGGG